MNEAYKQLQEAGLSGYLTNVYGMNDAVYAETTEDLILALAKDDRFLCGVGHLMHQDIGEDRCDYRSIRGSFGRGSLQVCVSRETWVCRADIDKFSPYDDLVGFMGHVFGEVMPGWLRRKRNV